MSWLSQLNWEVATLNLSGLLNCAKVSTGILFCWLRYKYSKDAHSLFLYLYECLPPSCYFFSNIFPGCCGLNMKCPYMCSVWALVPETLVLSGEAVDTSGSRALLEGVGHERLMLASVAQPHFPFTVCLPYCRQIYVTSSLLFWLPCLTTIDFPP